MYLLKQIDNKFIFGVCCLFFPCGYNFEQICMHIISMIDHNFNLIDIHIRVVQKHDLEDRRMLEDILYSHFIINNFRGF